MSAIITKPIGDEVALEVFIDLTKDITAEQQQELRRLIHQHFILLFRNQHGLTKQRMDEVMSGFGTIIKGTGDRDYAEVNNIGTTPSDTYTDQQGNSFAKSELMWHNDTANLRHPWGTTALYAYEVTDGASATDFANGARAYARLPQDVKDRIDDLDTLHIQPTIFGRRNRLADSLARDPKKVSPLVVTDPESGVRYLHLAELFIDSLVGIPEEESEALINDLLARQHAEDNFYHHVWNKGDLVIWEHTAVPHRRPEQVDPTKIGPRILWRVNTGTKSLTEQYAEYHAEYDAMTAN